MRLIGLSFLSFFVSILGFLFSFLFCSHLQSKMNERTNELETMQMKYTIATGNSLRMDYEQYNKREMETGKMLFYSSCTFIPYIPFDSISFTFKAYCYEHFFLSLPHSMQLLSSILMSDCHTHTHTQTHHAY